jgi:hypothetical protein
MKSQDSYCFRSLSHAMLWKPWPCRTAWRILHLWSGYMDGSAKLEAMTDSLLKFANSLSSILCELAIT